MGLFDNMLKNKLRKRKDGEIEKAENLMKEGQYEKARHILYGIYDDFPDDDIEYREDYIDQLIDRCGICIAEREKHEKQEQQTASEQPVSRVNALRQHFSEQERQFKECEAAALDGDGEAQFRLGEMYLLGQGIDADPAQAITWWLGAADQGNTDAMYQLGVQYRKGLYVTQD